MGIAVADMLLLELDITGLHVDPRLFIPLTTCLDGRVDHDEQNTSIVRVISGPPGALVGTGDLRYDRSEATTRRKNDHGVARVASHGFTETR